MMVLIQMTDSEKYIREDINMMGANYRKPNQEMEIDILPKWMKISFFVLKWTMIFFPMVISALMLYVDNNNLMWTCIWILSCSQMIRLSDEK